MTATVTLTFTIPHDEWLSSNQRLHWAAKSKRVKWLRSEAFEFAAYLLDPGIKPRAHPVKITAHIGYPSSGKADPNNAAPTTKALIDGLVEAGMFVDDSHEWVLGPDHRRDTEKSPRGFHTVRLEIQEMRGEDFAGLIGGSNG